MSEASRDGGPTTTTSQSNKDSNILVQRCISCEEKQGLRERTKTLKWLLQSPEAVLGVEEEDPKTSFIVESGTSICKHHWIFLYITYSHIHLCLLLF